MKIVPISFVIAAMVSPAAAQPAMNRIAVKGAGSWELLCHVTGRFGDETIASLTSNRGTLTGSDFSSVSCETSSAGSGPIVVSVSGPTAVCPFKGATDGNCEHTFKGAASFTVHTKRS